MTVSAPVELDVPASLEAAFKEVIEMMFCMGVEGPLASAESEDFSVAGMIGLAGAQFRGLLQISCTQTCARDLAAALLGGEEMLEDPAMVNDSMGELANMLGGVVKQHIDTSGVSVEISLPSVLEGEFHLTGVGAENVERQHYKVDGQPILLTLNYCETDGNS